MSRTDIWAVTVDPLKDFLDLKGPFHKAFPEGLMLEGMDNSALLAADRAPLVKERLASNANFFNGRVHNVICRSSYQYNEFGVPMMQELCVYNDGRTSQIDDRCFDRRILKRHNSLFSSPQIAGVKEIPSVAIFQGLTLTSCVQVSVNNLLDPPLTSMIEVDGSRHYLVPDGWEDTDIVVIRDACAYRPSQQERAAGIYDEWKESSRIHVVGSAEEAVVVAEKLAA